MHGKVQGVFFRKYTDAKANALGLLGTVENLPDGTVKVIAVGPAAAVKALEQWCRTEGSPKSRVDAVDVSLLHTVKSSNNNNAASDAAAAAEAAVVQRFVAAAAESCGGGGGFGILRPPRSGAAPKTAARETAPSRRRVERPTAKANSSATGGGSAVKK